MSECHIIIMAGGTGGHVFPGLAIANRLQEKGVSVSWLGGARGVEHEWVPRNGIVLHALKIQGLRGRGIRGWILAPFRVLTATWQALRILRQERPNAVISMGGYAAGPGGLAARLLGIPLLVHEQNRIAGLTNRILARMATRIYTGFEGAFPEQKKLRVVGNPVRHRIQRLPEPEARIRKEPPWRILVLGGSQGAVALNEQLPAIFARIETPIEITHQCGKNRKADTAAAYERAGVKASIHEFVEHMDAAYEAHDLVIGRSGASTVAELAVAGMAAILVPFPHAVDDHQTANAQWLKEVGAARIVQEGPAFAEQMQTALSEVLQPDRLARMSRAARDRAHPHAALHLVEDALPEVCP